MTRKKISVFIITLNEAANIERCLRALSWADEIIIVDSGSGDATLDLCRRYTSNIYTNKFIDFSKQKNFALSKVSNEWVLGVDADEECTSKLRSEIEEALKRNIDNFSGFYIKRRSMIFGRWFNFCGTQNDFQMRLFKKDKAVYQQPIHEIVKIDGKVSQLKCELLHYTYKDINGYIKRLNRYTDIEADTLRDRISKGKALLFLIAKPLLRFLNLYIARQGFRDGMEGLLFSVFSGVYEFVKYSKLLLKE